MIKTIKRALKNKIKIVSFFLTHIMVKLNSSFAKLCKIFKIYI